MPTCVPERDKGISPILPRVSPFLVCFLHSGLSVSFLSLFSVSQLCILPGGNSVGGDGFLGAWIWEGGGVGHAVVLFLSLGDMARRDSGRDGGVNACMFQEMSAEISLGSSMGVKAAGWSEGMVAWHFIPFSCCGFPRGNSSLEQDR